MLFRAVCEPREAQASHAQTQSTDRGGDAFTRAARAGHLRSEGVNASPPLEPRSRPEILQGLSRSHSQPAAELGDLGPRRHHHTPACHVSRPRAPALPSLRTRGDEGGLRGQANAAVLASSRKRVFPCRHPAAPGCGRGHCLSLGFPMRELGLSGGDACPVHAPAQPSWLTGDIAGPTLPNPGVGLATTSLRGKWLCGIGV